MTYARARLYIGISGVGTLVLIATLLLTTHWHETILPRTDYWLPEDAWSLAAFIGVFLLVMLPFDYLGGFVLPNAYRKQTIDFGQFFGPWLIGVSLQSTLFFVTGLGILSIGRVFGVLGVTMLIIVGCLAYVAIQGKLVSLLTNGTTRKREEDLRFLRMQLRRWNMPEKTLQVVKHKDPGFTGGIVGLPRLETIVLPDSWFEKLSTHERSVAVARRLEALESGSRTLGLALALAWIVTGFVLSTLLPGAGVTTVTQIVTTSLGFTLWSFLGLLTLPTASRQASYAIDRQVLARGVSAGQLGTTIAKLDRLQDDEPTRPRFIETIFHPVPSVSNRNSSTNGKTTGAWHAARMTLFLSWACLGLLSRAVHCNAGRPELWVMLPTD